MDIYEKIAPLYARQKSPSSQPEMMTFQFID
jgi:hypothetical protein